VKKEMGVIGFLFIGVYLVIIILVLEITVTLLIITGLEKDIARFQVVSMLTATGFTTRESELILRHPVRRKISIFLILFGVFSLAVLISTMSSMLSESFRTPQIAGLAVLLLILLIILRNRGINQKLVKKFEHHLKTDFELHELPIQEVLYLNEEDAFQCVPLHEHSGHIGRKIPDFIRPDEDLNVLFIHRGDINIRDKRNEMELQLGDNLYLYGSKKVIFDKFKEEIRHVEETQLDEKKLATLE
jgi:hypothetical protein